MAKPRKTRKQKKLADLRHSEPIVHHREIPVSSSPQYSLESLSPIKEEKPLVSTGIIPQADYMCIKKDLLKILMLTAAIVITQLALSFGLHTWR